MLERTEQEECVKPNRLTSGSTTGKAKVATSPRSLRRAAMDCLARREHSFFELKQKLQLRYSDRSPAEIQDTVERLRQENLQSDRRFVESYVRTRKNLGYGYAAIRDELRRRFVAEALIDQFLHKDDGDWEVILGSLVERRLQDPDNFKFGSKQHLRLARFLQRRGFSQASIRDSLAPYLRDQ